MGIPIVQPTRCTCYLKLFIPVKCCTCFGRSFRPSSGAQNCVCSNEICCHTILLHLHCTVFLWCFYVFCLFGTEKYNIHRSVHHNIFLQYNQQDAPVISNYLFLWNALHVSDGLSVHHQLLLPAGSSSYLTHTVAVYAVLSSWWWTERPSETYRAFYKNK